MCYYSEVVLSSGCTVIQYIYIYMQLTIYNAAIIAARTTVQQLNLLIKSYQNPSTFFETQLLVVTPDLSRLCGK